MFKSKAFLNGLTLHSIFFILGLLPNWGFCQEDKYIYGNVCNSKDNSPIPYANVYFTSTGKGTVTNEKGDFKLWISDKTQNDSLTVSFVGYKPFKRFISFNTFLDSVKVKLDEQSTLLQTLIQTFFRHQKNEAISLNSVAGEY